MELVSTASLTIGPFFHFALTTDEAMGQMASPETKGERVQLVCRLTDGDGAPVSDAMIELWQADASGKYNHPDDSQEKKPDPAFHGFGRLETNDAGVCVFETVKPGRVPGPTGAQQAPHINVSVFARGLLKRLATRIYFAGDPANAQGWLERALAIQSVALDGRGRMVTLRALATVEAEQRQLDRAIAYDREALALAIAPTSLALIRIQLAVHTGAAGHLSEARAQLDEILSARRRDPECPPGPFATLARIASIFLSICLLISTTRVISGRRAK